ncbi:DUF6349 family protein [Agromyces bauzanensis]
MTQLTFDIDAMIHELDVQTLPEWNGAPLHFTTRYHTPAELDAAMRRYIFEHGHFDCIRQSHMWNASFSHAHANTATPGHDLFIVSADLRCAHYGRPRCQCVGDPVYRAICIDCDWHADGTENTVVSAWHDHAWPGWRDLPVVPRELADRAAHGGKERTGRDRWIEARYPTEWQTPGAPIITERGLGTRHVPGRSPWAGFDMSARNTEAP